MVLWYTIVPPSEAHCVVSGKGKYVVSSDIEIAKDGRRTYFAIPAGIPYFGKQVMIIDLTIQEINITQETYEKNQARYNVNSSTKFRVTNVLRAAETFTDERELKKQLEEIIKAATRAVTVKYDVTEVRASKQVIQDAIKVEILDDFKAWGLELVNFQIGDFSDTLESKIISNISRRREVEIETTTREVNAGKLMQARLKEAEAEETAKTREIAKDKVVAEKEQNKLRDISTQEKLSQEQAFEVIKTKTIKQAEINKEQASIKAEQERAVAVINAEKEKDVAEVEKQKAEINKVKLKLEGEGTQAKQEAEAKGKAAEKLEELLAQAKGKTELSKALATFDDKAIRALTAELIVQMQQTVGVATAEALKNADVKVFAGNTEGGKQAFDLGALISSMGVSNDEVAIAVLNRIGVPHDLGFKKETLNTEAASTTDVVTDKKKGR